MMVKIFQSLELVPITGFATQKATLLPSVKYNKTLPFPEEIYFSRKIKDNQKPPQLKSNLEL